MAREFCSMKTFENLLKEAWIQKTLDKLISKSGKKSFFKNREKCLIFGIVTVHKTVNWGKNVYCKAYT